MRIGLQMMGCILTNRIMGWGIIKSLVDAAEKLQAWKMDYNESRSYRALNDISPNEFKVRWVKKFVGLTRSRTDQSW